MYNILITLNLEYKHKGGIFMTIAIGEKMYAADILNLTFFPKGTILTFSSTAWGTTSAEFKNIWKICNAANHTADPNNIPDLTGKFLRGAESSGTEAGADSQSVTLTTDNLPSHNHGATGLSLGGLSTSGLSITTSGGHEHSGSGTTSAGSGGHEHSGSGSTSAGSGGHTHSVSGSTSDTSKSLTGNFTTYVIVDGAGNGGINFNSASGILSQHSPGNVLNDPAHGTTKTNTSGYKGVSIDAIHSHKISGTTPPEGGTHSHDVSVSISESGSHAHAVTVSIPESGLHTHTISGTITGASITGSTGSAGSGNAFTVDTVPVYYAVIYIIKVA
jgi:hypothetical protein